MHCSTSFLGTGSSTGGPAVSGDRWAGTTPDGSGLSAGVAAAAAAATGAHSNTIKCNNKCNSSSVVLKAVSSFLHRQCSSSYS